MRYIETATPTSTVGEHVTSFWRAIGAQRLALSRSRTRFASMPGAKRVLDEIMTDIKAKKQKKAVENSPKPDEEGDIGLPSTPVNSKSRTHPAIKTKPPKKTSSAKRTRRSLVKDDRKGRREILRPDFLVTSESESESESSSGDDSLSEPEGSRSEREKAKVLVSSRKENVPPSSTPVSKKSGEQSELSKTNALLHTLLKRIERQDKKISDLQSKLSQSSAISSASTDSTPRRRRASERRKEVPLEVRVSLKSLIMYDQ